MKYDIRHSLLTILMQGITGHVLDAASGAKAEKYLQDSRGDSCDLNQRLLVDDVDLPDGKSRLPSSEKLLMMLVNSSTVVCT